jgi:hypothetical protein
VRITVANSALPAHSRHGDLIPAPGGSCVESDPEVQVGIDQTGGGGAPGTPSGGAPESQSAGGTQNELVGADGSGGGSAGSAAEDATAGDEGSDGGGTLPFTGLALGTLLSLAALLLLGGWLVRRFGLREQAK